MKKLFRPIMNLLWRIQFKKELFSGPVGYHCRDCSAGKDYFCGNFYCPVEKEPQGKLTYKFEWKWYKRLLNKWKI